MAQLTIHCFVGELTLFEEDNKIVSLEWGRGLPFPHNNTPSLLLKHASDQLTAYFKNQLQVFDIPTFPAGSAFQKRVLTQIQNIPFGETRTYSEIATSLKSWARPVGNACGHNPIPIIIPCHRVVGKNGLGGYSGEGGLHTKRLLLSFERLLEN